MAVSCDSVLIAATQEATAQYSNHSATRVLCVGSLSDRASSPLIGSQVPVVAHKKCSLFVQTSLAVMPHSIRCPTERDFYLHSSSGFYRIDFCASEQASKQP